MIRLAAHNNGAQIHHQQLTKEDVPVIVDKCLSFIYAHGMYIGRSQSSFSMVLLFLTRLDGQEGTGVVMTPVLLYQYVGSPVK